MLDGSLAKQEALRRNEAARIITSWESNRRLQIKVAKKRNRMGPEERTALKAAVKKHGQDFRLIVKKYKWARARYGTLCYASQATTSCNLTGTAGAV